MQAPHIKASTDTWHSRECCDVCFAHFTHYLARKLDASLHKTYGDSKKEKTVILSVKGVEIGFKVHAHFTQMFEQLFVRLRVVCHEVQEVDEVSEISPQQRPLLVQLVHCLQVFLRYLMRPCDDNNNNSNCLLLLLVYYYGIRLLLLLLLLMLLLGNENIIF